MLCGLAPPPSYLEHALRRVAGRRARVGPFGHQHEGRQLGGGVVGDGHGAVLGCAQARAAAKVQRVAVHRQRRSRVLAAEQQRPAVGAKQLGRGALPALRRVTQRRQQAAKTTARQQRPCAALAGAIQPAGARGRGGRLGVQL